jgi:3-hydroxyacyl-[acyl-carrier-protein] dehydratase
MPQVTVDSLPHRAPFLFLSVIEELEPGRRGVGVWRISGDEDFFVGHFPGNPVVPGVLLAESLAQLSGLVAFSARAPGSKGAIRLAQVDVKFHDSVVPPAEVRMKAALSKELSGLHLFNVRAEVQGSVVAAGSLVLAKVQ